MSSAKLLTAACCVNLASAPRVLGMALAALATCSIGLHAQVRADRGLVVRQLSFEGNDALDDETLRISIASSQSSFFARSPFLRWTGLGEKRFLNETEFQRDVLRIEALYRQSGFIDAEVDTLVRRTETDIYIRFLIDEGEPIRVEAMAVRGVDHLLDSRDLRQSMPLQVGQPFNRLLMMASADTVAMRLADIGYPFAEVFRNFDTDRQRRTAAVSFDVEPGPRATVGRIVIAGTDRVDEDVVRKTLSIEQGRLFRQSDIYHSQLDLYRTQLFDYVSIGLVDETGGDTLPEGTARPVDMRVQVSEGPPSRVRLGGGYGTIDCFRALGSWTRNNFLGGGRTFALRGRLSQIGSGSPADWGFANSVCPRLGDEDPNRLKLNYNLTASLHEPFFFSRRTSLTVQLFAERYTEFQAYLREALGGDVGLTYRLARGVPVTLAYALSYGSTLADPAIFCTYLNVCRLEDTQAFTERLLRSTLSLSVTRERRNSVLNPSRGNWITAEIRYASPAIGSDTLVQFTKGTVEFASYHRPSRSTVLGLRLRLGTILPAQLRFEGQELKYVPTEERFYAGGANTVRGYGQNELGPVVRVIDTILTRTEVRDGQQVDVVDSVIRTSATGGNDMIVANAEYRFPIPGISNKISAAVFVDAGNVFARESEVPVLTGLRFTPGAGVRVSSPLGPIRLDIAFNPYPPDPSPLYRKSSDGTELVLVDPEYRPGDSFLGRFRLHFSVGQAF